MFSFSAVSVTLVGLPGDSASGNREQGCTLLAWNCLCFPDRKTIATFEPFVTPSPRKPGRASGGGEHRGFLLTQA